MNEEHTPIGEPITSAQQTPSPKPDWKHHFTTVTPLSRALAMLLFIALPFVGFWVGTKYGILARDTSIITESSMNQTEQNTAGEVETAWRYSTTTEVPEGWQELKDDVLGFSISFPNHYAFSKQELGQYGESQLAGAYTIRDASLPETRPTDCFGGNTMFTISLRNNIVTQEEIDSWGGEYSGEKQTEVNGREVWSTEYVNAVGSGVSMYINNLENNTAISIGFPGNNCGITRLLEDNRTLSSVGQQILDTLTVSEGLGTQSQAAFGQVSGSSGDESTGYGKFQSEWAGFQITYGTDTEFSEYGRGEFFLKRDNVILASLFVEPNDGSSCNLYLCNQTAESSYSSDTGVVWDMLGITSYSDAGQTGAKMMTYRTKQNGKVYYVQSEDEVWAKRVVDGMTFATAHDVSIKTTEIRYENKQYGFGFSYPSAWSVSEQELNSYRFGEKHWVVHEVTIIPKVDNPSFKYTLEVNSANCIQMKCDGVDNYSGTYTSRFGWQGGYTFDEYTIDDHSLKVQLSANYECYDCTKEELNSARIEGLVCNTQETLCVVLSSSVTSRDEARQFLKIFEAEIVPTLFFNDTFRDHVCNTIISPDACAKG